MDYEKTVIIAMSETIVMSVIVVLIVIQVIVWIGAMYRRKFQ